MTNEVLEMQNLTSTYMKGRTYGQLDDYVTTQIYCMHR